jgi:putative membrane protein insertion efficiency factor
MNPIAWLRRLPSRGIIFAVRGYQILLAPWLGKNCRFVPSCSAYMIEAVEKYGPLRGVWKGLCRIGRCHPFHPGGWDPP